MARVAVLASGEGTNLQALLDDSDLRAWIVLVVSDRDASGALRRAEDAGVTAIFLDPKAHRGREEYDRALRDVLTLENIDYVALAGWDRILTSEVVGTFDGRMVNIHPSLLPAFAGGLHAVRDALDWGVKVTGVTVHLVTEDVDHGPIVMQEAVPVEEGDDESSLLERVHRVEHRVYPRALKLLVEGRLKVEGRTVHVLDA